VFVAQGAKATVERVLLEGAEVGLQLTGRVTATDVVLRDDSFGVDAVDGVMTLERATFEGNTSNQAGEAQPTPSAQ
jgi:hypothetical protein